MKIFFSFGSFELRVKVLKFALDLDVIMTKIVLLSKKLCPVMLIASPSLFRFNEHNLE